MPSLSQLYRPRRFADVTGQDHVTATLKAELASGSLGHAFLFSGPRGVGKTTCARILAKALSCESLQGGEPCGACASCVAFHEGRVFDVMEIDAATHTGVDMIREAIIEHVRFAPAGKRKVYILDEAHMLSTASWNALLKTLEEPPSYAFFVFATTEWHKVPPTIVSRCQRFEFRRIQEPAMIARLQAICEAQQWRADPAVLALIASRSEGCLRDAETLLGQVGSLAESGAISMDTAGLVIPLAATTHALTFLEWCHAANASEVGSQLIAWQDGGISFVTLFDDVLQLLKKLLLTQGDAATIAVWKQGTDDERRLANLVGVWTTRQLHDMALMLMERRRDVKLGMDPVFVTLLAYAAITAPTTAAPVAPISSAPAAPLPTMPVTPPIKTTTQPVVPPVTPAAAPVIAKATAQDSVPVVVPVSPSSEPVVASVPVAEAASATSIDSNTPTIDIATVRRSWNQFIRAVEGQNHSLPFILKISKPDRIEGSTLIIKFPYAFHRDKVIADVKHLRIVEQCAQQVFQLPTLHVDGVVAADEPSAEAAQPQDVVGSILQAFGGSVVEST